MSQTAAFITEAQPEVESLEPHWICREAFPVLNALSFLTQGIIIWSLWAGHTWLAVPFVLVLSHLMHGQLIGFHEASHGLLRKNRLFNEVDGVVIGIFSFTSFSLYRAAHQTHHMHLSSARDEEFWPFVDPKSPRALRLGFALLELTLGLYVTPLVFMRTFFRQGSPIRSAKVRRRIWSEFILMAVVWTVIVTTVWAWDLWKYFVALYLVPAWIAGNLQAWRKYIEHVGLTGSTPNSSTRSIVAHNLAGRLVSFSLLHEPFHGIHHRHAGITHSRLPQHVEVLSPVHPSERPPFPSYRHALLDLLRNLQNPRVGAQWLERASSA